MTGPQQRSADVARRQRRIATLILGTFVTWAVVQFAAARLDWPLRWVGLIDLIALAVLGYACWQAVRLWRDRKETS
ncbi:DUF5337 family protein [Jannaschia sp. LMIT008]|uniref:DUF5337 family protein n=1 Tax=Jannaschia maritima TaxID=3032585 RepID=UPI0028113807|nr:DUF5337 family protein [Jannaschia sp. LMIT008]